MSAGSNGLRRARRSPEELVSAAAAGDRTALARLLSLVERGGAEGREAGRLVFGRDGGGYTLGITGAPGAGKSTLTDRLIGKARAGGERVAVLAIDPSSPYSGGAILGDRIRMQGHALDEGVFVRSMATRGHLGGLALAAPEAVRVLAAAGYPWIIVETVGVGQVEVEIVGTADTTVVVVNPKWGDAIQANKAGLLEIADVFVVNKADLPGAAEARRDLEGMLDLDQAMGAWRPPVVLTSAASGEGIDELWEAVGKHRRHLEATGELAARRTRRVLDELAGVVIGKIEQKVAGWNGGETYESLRAAVSRGDLDPYSAADRLLAALGL